MIYHNVMQFPTSTSTNILNKVAKAISCLEMIPCIFVVVVVVTASLLHKKCSLVFKFRYPFYLLNTVIAFK